MATGFYLFEDEQTLKSFLEHFEPSTWPEGWSDLSYNVWEVQEELSNITKAPL